MNEQELESWKQRFFNNSQGKGTVYINLYKPSTVHIYVNGRRILVHDTVVYGKQVKFQLPYGTYLISIAIEIPDEMIDDLLAESKKMQITLNESIQSVYLKVVRPIFIKPRLKRIY